MTPELHKILKRAEAKYFYNYYIITIESDFDVSDKEWQIILEEWPKEYLTSQPEELPRSFIDKLFRRPPKYAQYSADQSVIHAIRCEWLNGKYFLLSGFHIPVNIIKANA